MEIFIWFMFAIGCTAVAQSKGKDPTLWFVLGVLGGIFSLVIVAILPAENQEHKRSAASDHSGWQTYLDTTQPDKATNSRATPPPDDEDRLFCQVAEDLGLVTAEEAKDILHQQRVDAAIGAKQPIGKYLYEAGKITKEQISQILKVQERIRNR